MLVSEIYAITKNVVFEKPSSTIYDNYLIHNLNLILNQLFEENNMERIWSGKLPLLERVVVTSQSDDVPYEDIYCREIIPLGLGMMFMIDDDLSKYNLYETQYMNARTMNQKMLSQDRIDEAFENAKANTTI